jgi:ABC-type phosphate transport system ATPase subunit
MKPKILLLDEPCPSGPVPAQKLRNELQMLQKLNLTMLMSRMFCRGPRACRQDYCDCEGQIKQFRVCSGYFYQRLKQYVSLLPPLIPKIINVEG